MLCEAGYMKVVPRMLVCLCGYVRREKILWYLLYRKSNRTIVNDLDQRWADRGQRANSKIVTGF